MLTTKSIEKTGCSCEGPSYIPISLIAANTSFYVSCLLKKKAFSKFCGRPEFVKHVCILFFVGHAAQLIPKHVTPRLEISHGFPKHYFDVSRCRRNIVVSRCKQITTFVSRAYKTLPILFE